MRVEPKDLKKRNEKIRHVIQKNVAIGIVLVSLIFYFLKIVFF
jgi:uncharacterized membrane protein